MHTVKQLITKLLKRKDGGFAVSIYLPTHPKSNSQTLTEDSTRLKNALKDIRKEASYSEQDFGNTLRALYELADDMQFWKHQTRGLALFADSKGYDVCHLPYETQEAVYIQDRYIISPLVIMQSIDTEFHVLDVNATKPRLLVSADGTLEEIFLADMPGSFQEAGARDEYKPEQQHRPAPRGSGGDNTFHGHGVKEALEYDMGAYLLLIAKSVDKYLSGHDVPLLLVGEQSRVGNLRPLLNYKPLVGKTLEGNFENHTPQELYNIALPEVRAHDHQRQNELMDELLSSTPELVLVGDEDISQAAKTGRVKRMYVPAFRRTTDSIRSEMSQAIVIQMSDDILELESAIRDVLAQSGEIQAVEIEPDSKVAKPKALCRFPS